MDTRDKTIVVTGAARGIGRAIADRFAASGANLALVDTDEVGVQAARAACEARGVQAAAFVADISREEQVSEVFGGVARRFGAIHGLVNNAGIIRDALLIKVKDGEVVGKMSLAQWQAVIDVNLTGTFLCGREAAEHMVKLRQGGVIVNISSVSRAGNAGQSNYSAAKAGVAALTAVWAKELARYGVRVGAIAPGFTQTPLLEHMRPDALEKMLAPVPLKRLGSVEEIADAVAFIFENDFFTGRCIDLDGGLRF